MASLGGPFELNEDTAVYVISVAAELSGLHPQTLRQYDRLGLVSPTRTPGRGRRYSFHDIEQLREVQRLSQEEGINLAGIKRILELENHVDALRARVAELAAEVDATRRAVRRATAEVHATYRRDLVPVERNRSVVVWNPGLGGSPPPGDR
ncbi:MAG: heat shock protein transcriptional repressor HspR [Actinomycetes bacterium]